MSITITDSAAREAARIIAQQTKPEMPNPLHLRMQVVGGGCSGFQYKLGLDASVNSTNDEVFDLNGVPVVIDKHSLLFLVGVTVDYEDGFNGRGFRINNPNAKSTCGCGNSFSA